MTAPESPQEGLGELVYIRDLNGPQRAVQGVPRVVSGIDLDDLPLCRTGCGFRMLPRAQWRKLGPEEVARLRSLKVRRIEAQQICGGCYSKAQKAGTLGEFPRITPSNAGVHERFDIPTVWKEVVIDGGGYLELGEKLGVSRERARQLVKKLGLPEVDLRVGTEERDYFISETEHLVQCGLGVHEIARSFGLSDDEFVTKIGRLRERGLTTVRFDEYLEVAA